MKTVIIIGAVLLSTLPSMATSLARKLYCKDVKTKSFMITANVTKGEIVLTDLVNNVVADQIPNLEVKSEKIGQKERISFLQDGSRTDLPKKVFVATVDEFNTGSATSYDDTSHGKTKYNCSVDNLDLSKDQKENQK